MSHFNAYCKVSIAPVRSEAKDTSEIVTQILFGELIEVTEKHDNWWKITTMFDNYTGYVDSKQLRKLSKKETNRWLDGLSYQVNLTSKIKTPWGNQIIVKGSFLPFMVEESFSIGNDEFKLIDAIDTNSSNNLVEIAKDYLNAPYLWGGKTPFGIDCSGFTQQVFRFVEINLPRDASQQIEYGKEVDFTERQSGDVAFFKNKDGKIIHVGILLNNQQIIHASGQVRIDNYDSQGIIHYTNEFHTHFSAGIRRMI